MKPGPEKRYDRQIRIDLDTPRKEKLYAVARDRGTSAPALLREAIDALPEPKRAETEAAE